MAGDFGGLGGIIKEAQALDAAQKARPLVACPVCGEPLDKNSRGQVNCVYGHFRAESDQR